jgi:tetraacyldisaccharide 4'-kinase
MRIFKSRWLAIPLLPLSALYLIGWGLRRIAYLTGLKWPVRVEAYVISVGNLTVGGSGKTPWVIWLGEQLLRRGLRVAIVSRGWRRQSRGLRLVSDGRRILASVREAGDEPYLIARRLPSAVVIVDADRIRASRFAIERYGANVILLDDAFQHWSIARDLDILLVDSGFGLGNRYVVPAGPLREPIGQMRRAHEVVLTRFRPDDPFGAHLWVELRRRASCPVTRAELRAIAYIRSDGSPVGLDTLRGAKVVAVAGIGSPEQFFRTLAEAGVEILGQWCFPDHHWFRARELAAIEARARRFGAEAVVTTEKDLVRAQPLLSGEGLPWLALRIDLAPCAEDLPHWETLLDQVCRIVQ